MIDEKRVLELEHRVKELEDTIRTLRARYVSCLRSGMDTGIIRDGIFRWSHRYRGGEDGDHDQ